MYKIIGADDKEYGPVTAEQIRQWVAEGRANGQTMLLADGATEWKPLSAFPEFSGAAGPGQGAPPPFATGVTPAPTTEELLARDYDLDIGSCVSRAWQLVQQQFGLLVGGVAVFMLLQIVIAGGGFIPILGILISFATLFIKGPMMGGVYNFVLRIIRRQPVEIGDIFAGFRMCFVQLMLAYLVIILIAGICAIPGAVLGVIAIVKMVRAHQADATGLALAGLGGLVVMVPLMYFSVSWIFALPLVIDRQMEFWPAMQTSRKMVARHWWTVFALLIVCGLINAVGICACYVGVFISMPVMFAATMYAYEDIFGQRTPAAN